METTNYIPQPVDTIKEVGRRESITMRNPGCMLISMADFYAGSHSIYRIEQGTKRLYKYGKRDIYKYPAYG